MRTDDELTLMLRVGFDAATEHLAASPALATQVRRRHRVAQRRRLVVGVALPAAATAVGTVLAVSGGRAPRSAPIAAPSATQSSTTAATTSPQIKPVSYRVVLHTAAASPDCPAGLGPVGKTAAPGTVWVWSEDGNCLTAAVGIVDQLPADAKPITLGQLTGLRGTTDPANDIPAAINSPGHRRGHGLGLKGSRPSQEKCSPADGHQLPSLPNNRPSNSH